MLYELEFATGLRSVVEDELQTILHTGDRVVDAPREDALTIRYNGNPSTLLDLRTVIAVYRLLRYDVPRPKALLGHETFHDMLGIIGEVIRTNRDTKPYMSLYISAAGSDSSVMMRTKDELSQALGLVVAEDEGDLLLRIRRTPRSDKGWDVLVRMTPRPLATRDWRVCNYEGALNASVAAGIVKLTNPTASDRFLNIMCGSGTIMIERAYYPAQWIAGCDISADAIACTRANMAGAKQEIEVQLADAMQLPYPNASMDVIAVDLPFGQLVGSHDENEWLYPAVLQEAARVANVGARCVAITHEITLMREVLDTLSVWRVVSEQKITLSGLHPRIFVMERQ
ncbi:MAG: methyltransferase domain-containing protein [Chloroflexota bacterium]